VSWSKKTQQCGLARHNGLSRRAMQLWEKTRDTKKEIANVRKTVNVRVKDQNGPWYFQMQRFQMQHIAK